MERLTIAIADDNERMLEMLNALIQTENGMELVGTAANGEDAVELIRKNTPERGATGFNYAEDGWTGRYGKT